MPIYFDEKRKTYFVKVSSVDPVSGKRKQVMKRGFPKRSEAKQWEAEFTVSLENSTDTTFRELDEKYIAFKAPKKESTAEQERCRVKKYMPFCDMPMHKISKTVLMEWQTNLNTIDIATSTKNYLIGVVRGVFKFGHDFYGLPNHAVVLKKYKVVKKQEDMVVWTPEQFAQFLACVKGEHYRNIFYFMYWSGVRRGEALALRAEDFKNGSVRIYHQIKYYEDGFFDLKTESSVRTLKLPPFLQAYLKPILERCESGKDFVFGGSRSIPPTNLRRRFNDAIKESGVPVITGHSLRHSFASNCIANGVNIVALSKYLGHSNIEQTLNTYIHLFEHTSDEMLDILSDVHKKSGTAYGVTVPALRRSIMPATL